MDNVDRDAVRDALLKELERWVPMIESQLRDSYRKATNTYTGMSQKSLRGHIRNKAGAELVADLSFVGYMRLFDMSRTTFKNRPDGREIHKWINNVIAKQGIQAFAKAYKKIYKRELRGLPYELRSMAFGIARGQFTKKKRPWYNKKRTQSIYGDLYVKIMDAMQEVAIEQVKRSLMG